MREILYKNETSEKNKRRVICVSEISESESYLTRVRRTFIYIIEKAMESQESLSHPVFHITKFFNTKTKTEKFSFRIKGTFYIIKETGSVKINFNHALRIDVVPKSKVHQS